jgi:hypothetical protein
MAQFDRALDALQDPKNEPLEWLLVPGFLEVGDLADVEATLSPTPMLLEDLIDAQDRLVAEPVLKTQLQPVYGAYGRASANLSVRSGDGGPHVSEWLISHLEAGR